MSEPMTDERLAEIDARGLTVTFADVLALLEEVRRLRSGGWRPASEKPTEKGEYLTYCPGAIGVSLMYWSEANWYADGECWSRSVTQWQPLPPPVTEADHAH